MLCIELGAVKEADQFVWERYTEGCPSMVYIDFLLCTETFKVNDKTFLVYQQLY